MIKRVLDYIINQLLFECLVFIYLEGIAVEGFKELIKQLGSDCIKVLMIQLVEEHKEFMQSFVAQGIQFFG